MSNMFVLEVEALSENVKKHFQEWQGKHAGDSGIDLIFPQTISYENYTLGQLIGLGFKARMIHESEGPDKTYSWLMLPRSSIYKTPVRQCNSIGLIDAGYRGELKAPVDILEKFTIEEGTRLFQACAPDFTPFKIKVVNRLKDETTRGAAGFGSTN